MTRFALPMAFALLALVVALFLIRSRRRLRPRATFSSSELVNPIRPTLRQRVLWLPGLLRFCALVLLVIAIARPQDGFGIVQTSADAVAIEMVVDRSTSMSEEMEYEGRREARFEVVKQLFCDFVLGDGHDLKGRPYDPIGLVVFARFAETICPLTRAHDALAALMKETEMVQFRAENGTAIGDAIALAAARLRSAEEDLAKQFENAIESGTDDAANAEPLTTIKSKVIILLTDGRSNAGDITPADAAQLAADWGVKIYAIGIGEARDRFFRTLPNGIPLPTGPGIDEDMLRQIAEITGGKYWIANSATSLRQVYEQIDSLEKTEIHSVEYTNYNESFTPFAAAMLALLAMEALLGATILRRSP